MPKAKRSTGKNGSRGALVDCEIFGKEVRTSIVISNVFDEHRGPGTEEYPDSTPRVYPRNNVSIPTVSYRTPAIASECRLSPRPE